MVKSKLFVFIILLVSVVIILSGCASPISKNAVVVHSIPAMQQHQKTVTIKTQGGSETSLVDISNISDIVFEKAIEDSIMESGLFTQVIHGDDSDCLLNVSIINVTKPVFGSSFTIKIETGWSLSDPNNKKIFMRESITSSYTATMGHALYGPKRFRLAVEGAIRKNIRLGLMAISRLQLE